MKKVLQVFTVIILVLAIGALVLGSMLFARRELLKARAQALEASLVQLGALLEMPETVEPKANTFPEKDVGEITAQTAATEPELASFWKDYPTYLEEADKPATPIRREDLMNYYKVDPITGKPAKDANGYKIIEGEGTMDETLKKVLASAQYELDRLNQTRHQLRRVREELIATVSELNERKQTLRLRLGDINSLNNRIANLQDEISQLNTRIAGLENDKQQLQDEVAAGMQKIEELNGEIKLRDETIVQQRQKIEDLIARQEGKGAIISQGLVQNTMEAGRKGKVVSVNADWSYVVIELTDKALAEIDKIREALDKNQTPGIPMVDLFLKRGDHFVTKVRLVQVKREEKLGVADVLMEWQQMPVAPGDVVFY